MNIQRLSRILVVYTSLGVLMSSLLSALAWAADLRPVQRIPRAQYGVVGPFPLTAEDLEALIFPSADANEREALLDGLAFFTTPHTAAEGLGPAANQKFCLGCHTNSQEVRGNAGLVTTVSNASRAARSTPTNFDFVSLDPTTGGGRAPDNLDAITNTGRTAAFTQFLDFKPATNTFDRLARFGGPVQLVRPSLAACLPHRIPPIEIDPNLGVVDPVTRLSPLGFRRAVGERAAPPYLGRGLMEAIPAADILALENPQVERGHSSLNNPAAFPECQGDCIAGHHNQNGADLASGGVVGGDPTVRLSRFGLRAAGPTLLQFPVGGLNGELGFTSPFRPGEPNQSDINIGRPGCEEVPNPAEVSSSTVLSLVSLMRLTTLPEFGRPLLRLLQSFDPTKPQPSREAAFNSDDRDADDRDAMVQRGAKLFGIDLIAFANRMIPNRMPAGGDGRDPHAINQADRMLNCVGCHTPIQATGEVPPDVVGGEHLRFVWVPIFSDLLLHRMPYIDAERVAATPRLPVVIRRHGFNTFDLSRSLADDALFLQGLAEGDQWRTPPLMGLGRIGPPFLHDGRVYLSDLTRKTTPAGTVMTNRTVTNAPLVVRSLDDALRAAIELHDLPAPDDAKTPRSLGAGCPVPPSGNVGDVDYGLNPENVICPPLHDGAVARTSEAREVIRRYRALSPEDQQALIEFLKQL